ncbi:hypothetical protein GR927_20230 [Mycolicibacterium sp. 3033]|nr:hypothetical protein [Mycolicibacterium aurantiacum]
MNGVLRPRVALSALTGILLGYLAVIAAWPQVREALPPPVRWFGAPNSAVTIGIVVAAMILLGTALTRRLPGRRSDAPVAIVAALAVTTAILGVASYWRCQDDAHPDFFTPLLWTAALVKGGDPARSLATGGCPSPMPVALNIAQISALAALFMSIVGVTMALFRTRIDRLRVRFARSVTAVVGVDEDAVPLVRAVAGTVRRGRVPVVVTDTLDDDLVTRVRAAGARVVTADVNRAQPLVALALWHKIDRLYLLSPDPSTNLLRLRWITAHGGDERQRVPLIVRIDDPWQAAAWRAQHFGGAHNRWAADTVGRYEVTARRLLDRITAAAPVPQRLLVCGSSQLTTALCSDMLARRLELEYRGRGRLPDLYVVAADAAQHRRDYEFTCAHLGHPDRTSDIAATVAEPTIDGLIDLITAGDPTTTALIFVDGGVDATIATRIAARLPDTVIHVHDPRADAIQERVAIVGKLYTYRLSLDLPGGQAHDAWERAAALIHDRYVADAGAGATALPWNRLPEFYRESNRRQVRNALWIVEKIGGHTWNCWGHPFDGVTAAELRGLPPAEQLRRLGFDQPTAEAMARAEHEDWCRYYRSHGWRYGPCRDDSAKVHDKLVDWAQIASSPDLLNDALRSLAATLTKLRELGYRSRPAPSAGWAPYRRTGAVLARQRPTAWTWTAQDGSAMTAQAGDWEVREESGGESWSVRDDIFHATHRHLEGRRWCRTGTVLARPAQDGETVQTLEGSITAPARSWIVQGDHGDVWAVPGDEFERRYEPVAQDKSNVAGK